MLESKEIIYMERLFPYWNKLDENEKTYILDNSINIKYKKREVVHRSDHDCKGVMIIKTGQLRAFILSEEGREVTLFRVKENDVCILSASCLMDSLVFDVLIDTMEDTELILIPSNVMSKIMKEHMEIELFLYKTSTERFSDVMWLLQQILFFAVDKRIANFLWDELVESKSNTITYTHDEIARLIGSAREVVTRVLKYLAGEGVVSLERGKIIVEDKEKLKKYL